MAMVKTAISIDKPLFDAADAAARELDIPRSRVFVIALQEYLGRRERQRLLDQINAVYGDGLDEEQRELLRRLAAHQRQVMELAE
jgi:metal-responsive CopG/Arc/MetJ family transcriptional regulator